MSARAPLHVLFTMDCHPAATRFAPEGPKGWGLSARSIEGFCTRLGREGYAATLFVTPRCAQAHAPLMAELTDRGVELGLLVQPQSLDGNPHKGHLGRLSRDRQRGIIDLALHQFRDALGERPRSCRTALFSASDDTFAVLHELGFQQGSISSPGRRIQKHAAVWTGAEQDAHYVDGSSRLCAGRLPFLEVPVTTDPDQVRGGLAAELAIETGTLEAWHRPLIAGTLQRMEAEGTVFKALCFVTRNCFAYGDDRDRNGVTLDAILEHLDSLRSRYDVIPSTLAGAHRSFRAAVGDPR